MDIPELLLTSPGILSAATFTACMIAATGRFLAFAAPAAVEVPSAHHAKHAHELPLG